ncbi:DEAD/DEAH box helicase [Paractinoplanes atraurantiacus]|uniref:Superfamily II DNA or RNA helicase n=1 Tax=Paractinoplanes atraurantiacus TaxID=1036182 RepID=A0A285FYQ8_9ACTN|nr:DEAD/DEAH box helicase [Actinoplanes atraurantiacus]SNY15361.1 Superfamily II DNA or RNA helicase [Actinoplanes atraurantiacus]
MSPPLPKLETFPDLRDWQRKALVTYLRRRSDDFMAVATPGAGKTTFALRIAAELLADGTVEAVTVVCPTEHLKAQWASAAARVGIQLDHQFRNSEIHSSADFHGAVLTYAQVGMAPAVHRRRTMTRQTLVILDEIHHAGDSRSWGDGVKNAFEPAVRRLMLTGTPFRSDENPIPFVQYERGDDGLQRSRADSIYGYADALKDRVVRPVLFMAYSGETRWRTNAGDELAARLGEPMTKDLIAQAWRTALDHRGDWMPQVLRAADARLTKLREHGMSDAGGLIIASDQQTARAYAKLIGEISGEQATVVLSDDEGASGRIATFAASEQRWMVAVRMVSEGVDIPRLAVGVYATSASTPLYFAQAIGRFVRARRPGETATVFLPSVPHLLGLASEMEAQRDHILGARKEKDGLDDDLLERAQREENAEGELEKQFEALGATAELDQVIYDGASFGMGAQTGTAEEADYLGLPGLLTPDEVSMLLNKRQSEQLAARQRVEKQKVAEPVPAQREAPPVMTAGERRNSLRRQLNTLVAAHHHRTNLPHGKIHAELRRLCGGPPSAQATIEQLEERIATIQTL